MGKGKVRSQRNPYAYPIDQYEALERKVNKFMNDSNVQRALNEHKYRVSDSFRDTLCSPQCWPTTGGRNSSPRCAETGEQLRAAVNNTQKEIAYEGGYKGMIAMQRANQDLNFVLDGESLESERSLKAHVQFEQPLIDAKKRIRIFYAMAIESLEFFTDKTVDPVKKEGTKITHGVQLGFQEIGKDRIPLFRKTRGYSHGLNDDELESVWNYDKQPPGSSKVEDRKQGMDFRHRMVHEFGEQQRNPPHDLFPNDKRLVWHTITTEAGGKGHLLNGMRPAFFSDQTQVKTGPRHPEGDVISFYEFENTPLGDQLRSTIDQIAELLYDYPKQ